MGASRLVALLLLLALLATRGRAGWLSWAEDAAYNRFVRMLGFPTNDDCGFTRLDALRCIKKHIDRNHDGEISAAEFDYAKEHFMPQRMRALMWVARKLHWDYTLDSIKHDCDANHDGRFTTRDWLESAKTCLPGKADLCKFQDVCKIADSRDDAAH